MSHQTGIKCNSELLDFITSCKKNEGPNIFSVKIEDEQLKVNSYANGDGNFREDLENHLSHVYTSNEPSYIFFKIQDGSSPSWLLIFYSPDSCKTRTKMLYASTKSTLKNEFGSGNISLEYFATTLEEMSVKNIVTWYNEQIDEDPASKRQWSTQDMDNDSALADHFSHAMPRINNSAVDYNKRDIRFLTPNEIEKLEVKAQSFQRSLEKDDSNKSMLDIKMNDESREALENYKKKKLFYIKFLFNIQKEQIELCSTQSSFPKFDVRDNSLANQKLLIESGNAQQGNTGFHLIRFVHTNQDGQNIESNILILLVDPNFTKPKERMLYASFCGPFVNSLKTNFSIDIERRIEADDTNDVTLSYVIEKLYPQFVNVDVSQTEEVPMKFTKPKGPPGRGPRRIIK